MVKLNNIAYIFILLSAFSVGILVASEGGHGGSSSGGGNEGGGYASLSAPPAIPPSFNPTAGWQIENQQKLQYLMQEKST